ncbi:MAG: hypothetical protein NTY31_02010 [Candidatus Falkowbacteria bacterium]|nr:hypothetical protein [Candidatus Falkowbacteria bacterium]
MPTFNHYNAGESKNETERLYGNDNDLSAEDKIANAKAIDGEIVGETDGTSINEKELIAFGKKCDDYLKGKGELPANLTEEEARKLALIYQESLGTENKDKKPKVLVKLRPRHMEKAA